MITEQQFQELKAEITEARQRAERARGVLDQVIAQLKTEFQCPTLKAAKQLLDKLEQEAAAAQKAFDKSYQEYLAKWKKTS